MNELLPECLVAGMTADQFWHSYPKEIKPYYKAQELRVKAKDEEQFRMYNYIVSAIEVALYNALRGKGKKPMKHLEEPMLQKYEREHTPLTEEEEEAQVSILFSNLIGMQKKYEDSKKERG